MSQPTACGFAPYRFEDWLLMPQRAAVHLPTATAVIADPHLGYDQVRRRCGEAVPAFSLDSMLAVLRTLAAEHAVRQLVIAGDLVENRHALPTVSALLDRLPELNITLAGIVPGNHDRGLAKHFPALPIHDDGIEIGGWRVLHGDGSLPRRSRFVQGHVHPCVRLAGQAAPCYLVHRRRIVLPAFSTDAAGVNVLRQPGWSRYRCCVVAGSQVLDFGEVAQLKRKTASFQASNAR
jgi:putative SbcD/Mre11-related phosphoesterase